MAKDRASSILESARKASGREKKYKTTEKEKEQVSSGQTSTTNTAKKTTDRATSILESARKASGRNIVGGGRTSYSSASTNNSKPASNALGSAGSLGAKVGVDAVEQIGSKQRETLNLIQRLETAKSKTTDDYYDKRYKEEFDRLTTEHANDFSYPTAAQADSVVLGEMKAAEKEVEDITKQLERLQSGAREANWYDSTIGAIERGYLGMKAGTESYKKMQGQENEADKYNTKLQTEHNTYTDNKAKQVLQFIGEFIGQQAYNLSDARTIGLTTTGAGTAAVAGQAGPQIAAPEEIITVPAGAIAGYTSGAALNTYEVSAGNTYETLKKLGVSDEAARNTSYGTGMVVALLESMQLDELVDAYTFGVKSGAADDLLNIIGNEIIKRTKNSAVETTEEVLQEIASIGGESIAYGIDKGENLYSWEEVQNRLDETATTSLGGFGAMNIPAVAINSGRAAINNRANNVNNAPVNVTRGTTEAAVEPQTQKETTTPVNNNATQETTTNNANTPTQTTSVDPIEQAAREVVAEKIRKNPVVAVETMSINGETITPEDAKKASGYGKHGSELLADAVNKAEGKSFSEVKGEMHIAYMAGYSNQNTNIKTDFEQEAYFAGKKDRIMDNTTAKEKAKTATVYESGVVKNDNFKKLSRASQEVLETLAKDHKLSVEMKDKIVASIVNGVEQRAAGSHFDGKIEGSMATEKPLIKWAIHEDGHRMEQMATDEWNVLANALYERAERLGRRAELGLSQGTRFDKMKADHDRAGITKDTSGYFGEVVMRELETIFASPEEFNAWRAEIDGNAQVKTAWQKFMDFLVELINKAKATLAKATMSKEARAQARAEIAELERIKELYANAYKATSEAVTKRANEVQTDTNSTKNLEIKINEEYNGNISYAMEYWRTDLNAREFKQVEKWIRQQGNLEATKITDTANWYEGRINGEDLFVIYSTINADNPTVLYEIKGNEAKVELNILKDLVEVFENGESINQESSYAGWVSQGSWMQEVNSSQNNLGNMGSGQNNQNVRVLQRQSQGNGSRAFWNVIETLYKRQEQDGKLSKNKSYSLEESEIDDAINQSMTMEQAKDMIQRAFVIGEIEEWFDGEYKSGDEWLKGEGADSVAMVIENEWTLQQKFLDKIQGLMDEEFFVEDILEAYAKGTLTGKVKQNVVKRLDTSKPTSATDTRVFAPKDIKNAQEIYKVASERVTNANRDKVYQARADIIMFAHNRGAAEALELTQTELNKKLATWARYTARAKEVSMRINKDVALFNKWTGIENSNVLNRATVSQEELNNLVNDIKGDSNGWQRSYIMRTMLALDTHIDYSELNFEFVGTPKSTFGKSVNGLYDNSNRKITVKYNAPHTVSHEMGHFLDYQWARDLGCSGALTDGFSRDKVDGDVKQFITNFDEFIEQIENVADLRSEYTMDRKEVFARFVAKFVQWVDIVANGKRSYAQEYSSYNDKFTATQYIEFVRLLQEKSMLDSKKFENKSFLLEESGINNSDTMYRLPSDVSFSLEETNNTSSKDQKQLLDTIEQLKGQFEVTKFAKADAKKLAKMTRDILKEYDSKADTDETRKAIDELYQYIANGEGQNPAAWNDVYNRAYKIAQNIVENALVTDDYMYQEYKSLRDYLRNTPLKFNSGYDSVPTSYESFNDFRKKNMGRLKFTNDGMSIDSFYQELSSLYPEYFDSEEQTNTSDQLERIVDVLDEIQPTEVNPFDGQVQQASMHLANDLINRFFDIPQAKPTFADKAERRIINTRIKAKKQLDRVREQRDIKVEKEKAKRRDSLAKMSEKKKASVLRARIMRHTGELHKTLIKATDQKHIPPELENAVLALLYNINLESNYTYDVYTDSYKKNDQGYPTNKTKAFLALKEMYKEIAKNNDYGLTLASELYDSTNEGITNIFDEVMALSDKKIADMTSEELTKIYDAIRIVEHSILTANKMFAMKKWEGLSETAKAFEKSVATRRKKPALMKKRYTLDIETPITFFSHFGEAGNELFQAFRDAQDNEQVMIDELAERVQKIVSLEQVQKAEKELFEFTTTEGKKLTLSKAHIMDIYLLYNRKQGKKHLLYDPESEHFGNGIHQPEIKRKHIRRDSESTRLTKADLNNIISKLSAEDKAIADKLQKTTLKLAEWGNKACLDVFGYEKFNDPNYWTIKSAKESINQTPEKNKDIARSIKNMGSAKTVEDKATNALDIDGVFNVFNQHASDMITYAAWLGVMEDATKLYNYTFRDEDGHKTNRTFVSMLDKYAGGGGSEYYFNLMKDIQNGIGLAPDTAIEGTYTKLFGMAAKAKVAYKATVVLQQPTAIIRAASVINPLSILQAAAKGGVNLPAWAVSKIPKVKVDTSAWYGGWERALKYAPIASRKAIGGYEINSNDSGLKGVLFKPETKKGKAVEAVKESPLWAAGKADEITWGVLWNACEIETNKDKSLEKGSEEYYDAVSKLFTKVINETQVVDGVLQRSQLMRSSSGWVRPITAFKGEPTMALNGVIRAYDNLRYETEPAKRGKAIKKFGRSVGVFAVSAVFAAFARSLAVGGTGEDDEEYWKKVWKSFSGIQGDEKTWFDFVINIGLKSDAVNNINPFTWLPIASEIMSLMQGYDVERLDVASIGDFYVTAKKFIDSLDKEGKQTVGYSARQVLLKAAEFTGYSPYNLIRDIEGAIRTVRVETNDVKGLYEMEKWRTKPAANVSKYVDILYKAYSTDSDDYEYIYNDMIENGVDAEKIEDGMEERMKEAEGVEKVSELTKRYMSPDVEKKYDNSLSKIRTSDVWKKANETQRKEAEADLYNFLTSDSEDMKKAREEAMLNDVDSSEYALWQIAIEMVDQPKDEKGSGSYDLKEKAKAINSLNLGEKEMAYFYGKGLNEYAKDELNQVISDGIDIQDYINFKAATSDMTADKNANGKSIPNSKKRKVVNYLNSANLTDEEWNYFYYEIMDYKK